MTEHLFSRLSPDVVMDAVESLGFHCDARNLELNSYENRVFQIGIEDSEPLIGKFYRDQRWTDEAIIEEHEFTAELEQHEISAVPPMVVAGKTLHRFDEFRFTLYPRRGGRAPAYDDLDVLESLGRVIGRIHRIGSSRKFEHRPTLTWQAFGQDARETILKGDWIPVDVTEAYETVSAGILERIAQAFEETRVDNIRLHGDCHAGNVLMRDDQPHFVDFDDARTGPPIQDLWMLLSGERNEQELQLTTILEGYQEFNDFSLAQLRLIEPLRTLRIMYHAAWLARRWDDPAFPRAFPFFATPRYWYDHVLELREQWARLDEPVLNVYF